MPIPLPPLVFFDFDSTLVSKESFDTVLALALQNHPDAEKYQREIENITNLGMSGALDFRESLLQRFSLAPLPKALFETVGENLTAYITEGMDEVIAFLQAQKAEIFILSGGFLPCLIPVAKKIGIPENHVFGNTFSVNTEGFATEIDLQNPLSTGAGKGELIAQIQKGYPHHKTILVGDGANDLNAYTTKKVDIFCGFGGNVFRKTIFDQSPHYAHNVGELLSFFSSLL
ncbi:MAG: HAD-IB family phosphatase [Candidatus Peregrinibacteria bacterium]